MASGCGVGPAARVHSETPGLSEAPTSQSSGPHVARKVLEKHTKRTRGVFEASLARAVACRARRHRPPCAHPRPEP